MQQMCIFLLAKAILKRPWQRQVQTLTHIYLLLYSTIWWPKRWTCSTPKPPSITSCWVYTCLHGSTAFACLHPWRKGWTKCQPLSPTQASTISKWFDSWEFWTCIQTVWDGCCKGAIFLQRSSKNIWQSNSNSFMFFYLFCCWKNIIV